MFLHKPPQNPSVFIRGPVLIAVILTVVRWNAAAQSAVYGHVYDKETGSPLENANVYVSSTTIGTATGRDGAFTLTGLPNGALTLVCSRVGYSLESIPLTIARPESLKVDFRLSSTLIRREGTEVIAQEPKEWKRLLRLFVRSFIGESENADMCRILNPEVLDLHMEEGTNILVAGTDSVLRVENDALGYLLYIRIGVFRWDVSDDVGQYLIYPRFEKMMERSARENEEWRENRQSTFRGSLRDFLQSLVAGRLEQEGFDVHQGKLTNLRSGSRPSLLPDRFNVEPVPGQPFWKLRFRDWLCVESRGENGKSVSYIQLTTESAVMDAYGNLVDPLCLDIIGDWTKQRIADVLPLTEKD